ncbi:MAG TPA: oxidoreductase family protein [Chloroflexia bacterium]|nr:oxidoreductase family protein [Chloroflexia bacterium]
MSTPPDPGSITPAWLTDTWQASGVLQQARVTAVAAQPLSTEKGMTGQLFRVSLTYDSAEAEAPRSLIAKFSAPHPQARAVMHAMGFYEREARFYEELAPRSRVGTPRCYFSSIDLATGDSLLLLEDLGAARNGSSVTPCSVEEAELAVLGIAPFHAQWWGRPLEAEYPWLAMRGFTAHEMAQPVFLRAWEPFLGTLGMPITDQLLEIGGWLSSHLGRVTAQLHQEGPATIVHNDYYADNLFFTGPDDPRALVVADWQVATMGRGVVDVARFLAGSLAPADRRAHERRLLDAYHALLVAKGVADYPFAQCWDDYRLATLLPLARIATAIGMTAQQGGPRGRPEEVVVTRYCAAITDLRVGELL